MVLSVTTCGERVTKELEYSAELLCGGVLTARITCSIEESTNSGISVESSTFTIDGHECFLDYTHRALKLYPELTFRHSLNAYALKEFGRPVVELAPGIYEQYSFCSIYRGRYVLNSELTDTQFGLYLQKDCIRIDGVWYPKERTETCPKCGHAKAMGEYCRYCEVKDYKGNIIPKKEACRWIAYNRGAIYIHRKEYERDWCACAHCGDVLLKTELDAELGVCPICSQRYRREPILGYHEHEGQWPLKFYGADKEDFVGGGFELEIDGNEESEGEPRGDFNQEFAKNLASSCGLEFSEIRFERDGSLNDGFEIISAPHTVKDFWEKQKAWADMLDACVSAGFKSHDAGCCGLHVHVSKGMFGPEEKRKFNMAKLARFYTLRWDDFVRASRRQRLNYCRKIDFHKEKDHSKVCSGSDKAHEFLFGLRADAQGHGVALNNENSATFEYRLGRGTLNKVSFFAWIDLCFTITKNSRKNESLLFSDQSEWLAGIREQTAKYLYKRGAFVPEVLKLFPQLEWESSVVDQEVAQIKTSHFGGWREYYG